MVNCDPSGPLILEHENTVAAPLSALLLLLREAHSSTFEVVSERKKAYKDAFYFNMTSTFTLTLKLNAWKM
jgi:hypothetical protein